MAENTDNLIALFRADKDIPAGSYLALRDGQLYVWHRGPQEARKKKFQEVISLWDKLLRKYPKITP